MPKRGKKGTNHPASSSSDHLPVPLLNSETASQSVSDYVLSPGNIIVEQNDEIRRQDEQLVDLEASISNLRDASLTINQEVTLQNRLLGDVHTSVERVQERQSGTQDRLRNFMQASGTCKLWSLIIFLIFVLILLLGLLK